MRLEDMNSLFGDATTAAPTPATLAEAESLFSGDRSPVPSFRLGGGDGTNQDANVPDMDIDPPHVDIQNGKAMLGKDSDSQSQRSQKEGMSGWISNMVKRNKGDGGSGSGKYRRLEDDEGDDDQGTR